MKLAVATAVVLMVMASARAEEAPDGGDVLARCHAIVSAFASSRAASSVTVDASALPSDVSDVLQAHSLSWDALSDPMRVGLLWAYGYVLQGGSSSSLLKVYTACSTTAAGAKGPSTAQLAISRDDVATAGCETFPCGEYVQSSNSNCSTAISKLPTCAIDTNGSSIPSSSAPFWSTANGGSSSTPVPRAYEQSMPLPNSSTSSITLVSIHLLNAQEPAADKCGTTADAVIPCIRYADATDRGFCRPAVNGTRVDAFLSVIKLQLKASTAPSTSDGEHTTTGTDADTNAGTSSSSGISTGAIIGIVAGAVVVLGLLGLYLFRRRRQEELRHSADPYIGFDRKSSHGPVAGGAPGGRVMGGGFGRSNTTFTVMDQSVDNDTVISTDMYVGGDGGDSNRGGGGGGGGGSRPFPNSMLSSIGSGGGSSRGIVKTTEEYCEESESLRSFVNDSKLLLRRIPWDELTPLRILSKGSYGEVYLCQLETRHVAMKRLLPEKKHLTRSIEQFAAEIKLMNSLEHRNIVSFVGVSWDALSNLCAVVEYMDNGDLADVLAKSKGKLSWPKEKISITMDIAEGLVYLHSMRPVIVHRDLKSKNVLLNKRGQAKLTDFGVSRKTMVNETLTSGVGTLLWTAPEIIEGRKYSEKADIFSLGVVLSEIDTEEEPYATTKSETTGERLPGMQLVQMVRQGTLRVNFRPDCPPLLRELAEQCTSLDPDKRPTSMEVAYKLKSIIAPRLRR